MAHALDHWKWAPDPLNRKRKIRVDPDTGQQVTQKHISALKTQRDLSNLEDITSEMTERFAADDKLRMDRWTMTGARESGMATQVDPGIYDMTDDQKRKYTGGDGQYFKSQGHLDVFLDEDQAAVQKSLGEADASNIIETDAWNKREAERVSQENAFQQDLVQLNLPKNESTSGSIKEVGVNNNRLSINGSNNAGLTKAIDESLTNRLQSKARGNTLTSTGSVGGKGSIANNAQRLLEMQGAARGTAALAAKSSLPTKTINPYTGQVGELGKDFGDLNLPSLEGISDKALNNWEEFLGPDGYKGAWDGAWDSKSNFLKGDNKNLFQNLGKGIKDKLTNITLPGGLAKLDLKKLMAGKNPFALANPATLLLTIAGAILNKEADDEAFKSKNVASTLKARPGQRHWDPMKYVT